RLDKRLLAVNSQLDQIDKAEKSGKIGRSRDRPSPFVVCQARKTTMAGAGWAAGRQKAIVRRFTPQYCLPVCLTSSSSLVLAITELTTGRRVKFARACNLQCLGNRSECY